MTVLFFPDAADGCVVEAFVDPEAANGSEAVQLGPEILDFSFQLGSDQDSEGPCLLEAEELRDLASFGFVEQDQLSLVFDRQGDHLGLAVVKILLQGRQERLIGSGPDLDPAFPERRFDLFDAWPAEALLDDFLPDGLRDRQSAVEVFEQTEPTMAERWMRLEESQMTMRVAKVVLKVRIRVVARDVAVGQNLLELPACHPGKDPSLPQREHSPLIERQGQLLADFGLDLRRGQLHRVDNL
jgi:hypothetical protein